MWCANYTAHAHKSKVGQKPTYPKGQRRIDANLAAFLTYTSSIPYNENDLLCTTCYQKAKEKFDNITNASSYATSMSIDSNKIRSERAAARSALSTITSLNNIGVLDSEREHSSSDNSDQEITPFKLKANQDKSKELLNNVLSLVNEPPIKDIRNRDFVQQKIDRVLKIIREAAEEVYGSKEEKRKLDMDNKPNITMNDAEELISNFKLLISSSDYSEKIRLLTLVPKSWGRVQITNFFQCSEHQARYSIYLRDAEQILSLPLDLRGNMAFDPIIEKEIFEFFHSDEISRV
jgi:hypothetical protein